MRLMRWLEVMFLVLMVFGTDDLRRFWLRWVLRVPVDELRALDREEADL